MSRKRKARPWIVIDAETDPFLHGRVPKPFCWVAYDGTNSQVWWNDHEGFIDWLMHWQGIAYAHNGGKFDFHFLADYMSGDLILINDRIASVRLGECELRDSWCLCPQALSAYKKDEIDYDLFEEGVRELHKTRIVDYCKSDVEYLWEILAAFHGQHAGLPLTLPSAGIKALCRIERFKVPDGSDSFDSTLRPFYFGGRCEAIRSGQLEGPYLWHDINSAYPYAMTQPHWWGLTYEVSDDLPKGRPYFARVDAIARGCLPIRMDGKLQYPRDMETRTYFASHWEIEAGFETGTLEIARVHETYTPCETKSFANFVQHYWSLKERAEQAGDDALRYVAKIVLNGTYGKLAQDPRRHIDWSFADESDDISGAEHLLSVGGRWVVGNPTPMPRFYNVATAASITGFVRAYLWRALCRVQDPIYCDTDCIISRSAPPNVGRELGQWKPEGVVSSIAIAGRKLYAATMAEKTMKYPDGVRVASKGCRLDKDDIVSLTEGAIIEWQNDAPSMSLARGVRFTKRRIKAT